MTELLYISTRLFTEKLMNIFSSKNNLKIDFCLISAGTFGKVFSAGTVVKNHLPIQEMQVGSLGQEDPLKKEMATHSSILAWETPSTEELVGLQSTGFQEESDMT